MLRLKKVDKVAYIRFASVYSAFDDVGMFQEALAGLTSTKRKRSD